MKLPNIITQTLKNKKYYLIIKINQVYICEQIHLYKNGKCYIGSAVDLLARLIFYYSAKAMENYLKIVKVKYVNFSLTILEYCDNLLAGDKKNV